MGILKSATREQLAHAVEANQAAWIVRQGALVGSELHRERDVTWVRSKLPGRANAVAAARFTERTAERRIEQLLLRYKSFDAPVVWWVGPGSTPTDLGRRLRIAGFHCFKHFPGMVADLDILPRASPAPRGLSIEVVPDFSIFDAHEHPYIGPITTDRRRNILESHRQLCAARPRRAWALVANLRATPVGYSLVLLDEGVAGIYWVGVIKRHRRQGIGSAMTRAAMEFARQREYHYAILQASGEGESVYRRLGFEEVCRMSLWYYSRRHHLVA